jgi:hypothetical protein
MFRNGLPAEIDCLGQQLGASSTDDITAGLDERHIRLIQILLERKTWAGEDFAAEARRQGLYPDCASETLNDWYFDRFDEAFVEQGEPMIVNAAPFRAAKGEQI